MRKIVINNCYGGFGLSSEALKMLAELGHNILDAMRLNRDFPDLVKVVETLGEKASAPYANLLIIEIPEDVNQDIEEYDGMEWVVEKHRIWGK